MQNFYISSINSIEELCKYLTYKVFRSLKPSSGIRLVQTEADKMSLSSDIENLFYSISRDVIEYSTVVNVRVRKNDDGSCCNGTFSYNRHGSVTVTIGYTGKVPSVAFTIEELSKTTRKATEDFVADALIDLYGPDEVLAWNALNILNEIMKKTDFMLRKVNNSLALKILMLHSSTVSAELVDFSRRSYPVYRDTNFDELRQVVHNINMLAWNLYSDKYWSWEAQEYVDKV